MNKYVPILIIFFAIAVVMGLQAQKQDKKASLNNFNAMQEQMAKKSEFKPSETLLSLAPPKREEVKIDILPKNIAFNFGEGENPPLNKIDIINSGNIEANIMLIRVAGDNNFVLENDCSGITPAGASCSANLRFKGKEAGEYRGSVLVGIKGQDPIEIPLKATIKAKIKETKIEKIVVQEDYLANHGIKLEGSPYEAKLKAEATQIQNLKNRQAKLVKEKAQAEDNPWVMVEDDVKGVVSSYPQDFTRSVIMGSIIRATLVTEISNQNCNIVKASVSRDVHGYKGYMVVIPAGSTIIGKCMTAGKSSASGVTPVDVSFETIIRPDGAVFDIKEDAADMRGRGGMPGYSDVSFLKSMKTPLLTATLNGIAAATAALLDAGSTVTTTGDNTTVINKDVTGEGVSAFASEFSSGMNEKISTLIDENINIVPPVIVPVGTPFTIVLSQNITLKKAMRKKELEALKDPEGQRDRDKIEDEEVEDISDKPAKKSKKKLKSKTTDDKEKTDEMSAPPALNSSNPYSDSYNMENFGSYNVMGTN